MRSSSSGPGVRSSRSPSSRVTAARTSSRSDRSASRSLTRRNHCLEDGGDVVAITNSFLKLRMAESAGAREAGQLPSAPLGRDFLLQKDATTMDALRQIDQGPTGAAALEDDRMLCSRGTLDAPMVVGHHRGCRQAQRPLDLGAAMVMAVIVAIDHQCDAFLAYGELGLEQAEGSTRAPESDQITRRHEQNLLCLGQRSSVHPHLRPDEIRSDIQNDVAIALT